jgi:hypothetical protein
MLRDSGNAHQLPMAGLERQPSAMIGWRRPRLPWTSWTLVRGFSSIKPASRGLRSTTASVTLIAHPEHSR